MTGGTGGTGDTGGTGGTGGAGGTGSTGGTGKDVNETRNSTTQLLSRIYSPSSVVMSQSSCECMLSSEQ